jgi:hypothetical protein
MPKLYQYGFLTSRALGVLSRVGRTAIGDEEREVLSDCEGFVKGIIRGKDFLIGPNPEGIHNLRPEDVETFTFLLANDSQLKALAGNAEQLRQYFERILNTLGSLTSIPPAAVAETEKAEAKDFLSRISAALIETAKANLRRAPRQMTVPAPHAR